MSATLIAHESCGHVTRDWSNKTTYPYALTALLEPRGPTSDKDQNKNTAHVTHYHYRRPGSTCARANSAEDNHQRVNSHRRLWDTRNPSRVFSTLPASREGIGYLMYEKRNDLKKGMKSHAPNEKQQRKLGRSRHFRAPVRMPTVSLYQSRAIRQY
ncbi:hypothetical protein EVAR_90828_1 [Eumeta japonica]|uniref:Uncharacterized protein n=1 Tax=Eumeta variegata TaxID=151549 RepID=A0A4C1ZXS4_EUMVA|nr:hypothetical protein EVAR_90828_1 [Eumeta japonica]